MAQNNYFFSFKSSSYKLKLLAASANADLELSFEFYCFERLFDSNSMIKFTDVPASWI